MGLAGMQGVLARLYTDRALREHFFAHPAAVGRELGLNEQEVEQLAAIGAGAVGGFANSLVHKRLGEIRKLLSLTCRTLDNELPRLFRRFAETYVPTGIHKHRVDAIAFAEFLSRENSINPIEPVWLADLARYEAANLKMSNPRSLRAACRSHFDLPSLLSSLLGGEQRPEPPTVPTLIVWFRLRARAAVRRVVLRLLPVSRRSKRR